MYQEQPKSPKEKSNLRKLVEEFKGKKVNNEVLASYCKRHGMEMVAEEDFQDYVFQYEHDEKMLSLFPEILAELQKLEYRPELVSVKRAERIKKNNQEVFENLQKLIEKHGLNYHMIDPAMNEFATMMSGMLTSAGTAIFNKATGLMLHITKEHFGEHPTSKHFAEYAEKLYAKNNESSEDPKTSTEETPEPETEGDGGSVRDDKESS